jgi:hypothetical protein
MPATNADVRRVVFDALELPGVNRYQYPPESVQVPAAVVAGIEFNRSTFDGNRTVDVGVQVLVSHSDHSQLRRLDELLDPSGSSSVLAALEAVTDDDGVSLAWREVSAYGEVEWGGESYYGATVVCTAYT